MKKTLVLFILCQFCLVACQHQPKPPVPGNGLSEFSEFKFEMDTVTTEDPLRSHKFVFRNTGTEPLVVNQVEIGCHCTTVEYTKQPVNVGDTGHVTVTFNARESISGHFERWVTVYTNSKELPVVRLTVTGVVPDPDEK